MISDAEFYSWRTTKGWRTRREGKQDDAPAAERGKHPALLVYVCQKSPERFSKIIRKLGRLA